MMFAFSVLLSIVPVVGLAAAFLDLSCLVGHSPDGVPWSIPAAFALACFGAGWWVRPAPEWKFRLLSLAWLLGASMFGSTPLHRALEIRYPAWEVWPLFAVSALLLVEGWQALESRRWRFRVLALAVFAAVGSAVIAPWIPFIMERWGRAVIGAGYVSVGSALALTLYAYETTRRRHARPAT